MRRSRQWLLPPKRARLIDTTEDSDAHTARDSFKGFIETELTLLHSARPSTRAALASKREAFIRTCDREMAFLQRIDATSCMMIVSWIYSLRARLEVHEYTTVTMCLALHIAYAYCT